MRARERIEQGAVAVETLAEAERAARRDQFVAADEDADARPPVHRDRRLAETGQHGECGRTKQLAGRDRRCVAREVVVGRAHVGAGDRAGIEHDIAILLARVLADHHGVGAHRHRRPGHDAHAGAGIHRGARALPRQQHRAQAQPGRRAGIEFRRAHRIAVHRRMRETGHVEGCGDGARRHPAERRVQRQRLRRQRGRRDPLQDRRAGGGEVDHPGVNWLKLAKACGWSLKSTSSAA
jgi:hypothetical protein